MKRVEARMMAGTISRQDTSQILAALVLLLFSLALATPVSAADVLRAHFEAPVSVSADGSAEVGVITGVSAALAEVVRQEASKLRFVAARQGGQSIASTGLLSGEAVLTPVEPEDYAVSLRGVALQPSEPRLDNVAPPHFPPEMYRRGQEGTVLMALRVGENGRIEDARTLGSTDPAFERAVRAKLPRWRFEPGTATEIAVPFWFRLAGKSSEPPAFDCPAPVMAHVVGQDGCWERIEIIASRMWP